MTDRFVYLDHAATTPVRQSVVKAMEPYFTDKYGNASSPYSIGRESRAALDKSRDAIAEGLGVDSREIIFTAGATESIINSIIGAYLGNRHRGNHILTSSIEHPAVHAVLDFLKEKMDAETELVDVDSNGILKLDELESKLRDDTVLVSVMNVNNEVGSIQDIKAVVGMCEERGIMVHSDCVQSIGKMPLDLADLGVDLSCMSGHKFGGPKGIGVMYVRQGTHLEPICEGSQEFGFRAGTENVAGIVGMAVAFDEAVKGQAEHEVLHARYKQQLFEIIRDAEPAAEINGDLETCIPATLSVWLPGCSGEMLVLALDRANVAVSTGSACHTGAIDPSHVLTAMGMGRLEALGSIRISMGHTTSQEDIDRFGEVFAGVYEQVKVSAG